MFSSSPYKERLDNKTKEVNEINFKMSCTVFLHNNISRDNLIAYYSFDDSEGF